MSALLHAVFRNQASRTFFSEKVMDGGRELEIRSLEPVPGVRLGWVRRGDFFIASLSRDLLVEAVRVCDAPELGPAPPLASGTAKALGLRPAALVREAGSGGESATAWNLPAPLRLFLGELEEVHLSTREVGDHLSLELHVPRITPTVRAVLRKLTTIPRER
jgi:hypothetical protein